jgi:hypothetical protein
MPILRLQTVESGFTQELGGIKNKFCNLQIKTIRLPFYLIHVAKRFI